MCPKLFLKTSAMLLISVLLSVPVWAQIAAGTYTIGADVVNDYQSIQEAVDSIMSQGLAADGNVIFNIADGDYQEQVTIGDIPNADANNTVTFQSASGDSTKVSIMHATSGSSNCYVVKLDGTDYVRFNKIRIYNYATVSYVRVVEFAGNAVGNQFTNCEIIGYNSTSTSNYAAVFYTAYAAVISDLVIDRCSIQNGSYAIYLSGSGNVSTNVSITNNLITSRKAIYLKDMDRLKLNANTINASYSGAIELSTCDFNIEITNNKIHLVYNGVSNGIYLDNCDGNVVDRGLIANNSIVVEGSYSSFCSGMLINGCESQSVINNSIHLVSASATSSALRFSGGGTTIQLINNNIVNSALGYTLNADNDLYFSSINYNNYYTGGNFLAYYSSNIQNLSSLQAKGGDANSTSVYPSFTSNSDLRPLTNWLNGTGSTTVQNLVAADINGTTRDVTAPDVGAYEFSPSIIKTYSGIINVGAGQSFTTIMAAVDSLELYGLSGPVTVAIDDGTYAERIIINEIPGASAVNRVTFQSVSMDSSKASVIYNTTTTSDVSSIVLQGTDYITFSNLGLSNSSTTSNGRVLTLYGNATNVLVDHCLFNGSGAPYANDNRAVIYSVGQQAHNLSITNNDFNGGSRHIVLGGIDATPDVPIENIVISDNLFGTAEQNIRMYWAKNISIQRNQLSDFTNTGIVLGICENPLLISQNKLQTTLSDDQPIYLEFTFGALGGTIVNNFMNISSGSQIVGLHLNTNQYLSVFNNSINVVGNATTNAALFLNNNSNLNVKNNNFIVNGNGYAIYGNAIPSVLDLNYNNLYTTGANLVYWVDVNYASLADYRTGTSLGANSVNVNPNYVSATDLHTNSYWLDGAGVALTGVDVDIDGDTRQNPPCIGADEYTSTLVPLAGTYEIGTGADFTTISDAVQSLSENGTSGQVIFEILTGNYNEQFEIPQIFMINDTDSVIFTSKTKNAADVSISFEGTNADNNFIAKLSGADRLTFQYLTFSADNSQYSQCISMAGNINRVYIKHCVFQGRTSKSTNVDDAIIYASINEPYLNTVVIDSNVLNFGSWGVCMVGSTYSPMEKVRITNNVIHSNYKGILVQNVLAPYIFANTVSVDAESEYVIKAINCNSSAEQSTIIMNNKISSNYRTYDGALYLRDCDGSGSNSVLVANNSIQTSSAGLYNSRGMFFDYSDNFNCYYNSVNVTGNYNSDQAMLVQYVSNANIFNNNLAIRGEVNSLQTGAGLALSVVSSSNIVADNNNLYTPGKILAYWQTVNCASLKELQTQSSQFQNSINVFPSYFNFNNLNTSSSFVNGKGVHYALVTKDINGNLRDELNTDIGAYEILNPSTPLAGNYEVGAGAALPTLDSMFRAIMFYGVSQPVTFNIIDGSYSLVHFMLKDIPGANSNDTIVIQSKSQDSSKVVLIYGHGASENYTLFLDGTDYLSIQHLGFATSSTSNSRFIVLNGNTKKCNILHNKFDGITSGSDNSNQASVFSFDNQIIDSLLIAHNLFNYNSYGICLNGNSDYVHQSIEVSRNKLNNQYYQIYFFEFTAPNVADNVLNNTSKTAIYLYRCYAGAKILRNHVFSDNYSVDAIYLHYSVGLGVDPGIVANNFVQVKTSSGIRLYSTDYFNLYYNSIHHTGDNSSSALQVSYCENIKLKNNLLFASGTGYALNSTAASSIVESDYNNYYTNGTRFIYIGSYIDTLPDLRTTTGMDANSLQVKPEFLGSKDLHLINFDLMEKGTPIVGINNDIDNELRDAIKPDIGADEMYARPPIVESKTICEGETTPTLLASGINIKWYSDEALSTLVWTANGYNPGVIEPGVYTYYVTQTIGDDVSEPTIATLTIIAAPVIDAVVVNIDCQGNNYGGINLSVSSENEPFYYRWSNEATSEDVGELFPGKYFVTVEDIIGCTSIDSFIISAPDSIQLTMIENDADCGEQNGGATIFAEGGLSPYSYQWTTGDTTAVVDSLMSGIYVVSVTDKNGCTKSALATINDLGGSIIKTDAITDVSCFGASDGAIALSITGGITPYQINWSNGSSSEDISSLSAGAYDISVTDAENCHSVKSIVVEQPLPIKTGLGVYDALCGQANGHATTQVSGGTAPYSYAWTGGATAAELTDLNIGVYSLTVIDNQGCNAIKSFAISEIGAPRVYVDSIFEGTCGGNDGAVYITSYGTGGELTYLWSTGAVSEDLIGVNAGEYSVTVTDTLGCSGATVASIFAEKPQTPNICIVTVDTASNMNEVVWQKPISNEINQFNIYRESSQAGVYQLIGSNDYSNESLFVDANSNAMQRSYRYKISTVNNCGVESDLSEHHNTMHLTVNKGLNGDINLIWDHYEGFSISTYFIYRYTDQKGWVKYDSIASNLTSYTDFEAPEDNLQYFIEIVHPTGCTASKASDRNSGRSNIGSIVNTGIVPPTYNVSFVVDDNVNVIEGANIDFAGQTKLTDVNGGATFADIASGSYIVYTISKAGYDAFVDSVMLVDQDVNVPVHLVKTKVYYNVVFTVASTDGPIDSAQIRFNNKIEYTNNLGLCTFDSVEVNAAIAYSIIKQGFENYSGTVDVIDQDKNVEVIMVPAGTVFSVTFTVQTGTVLLENAQVTFNQLTQLTDVNGQTIFSGIAPSEGMDYTVELAGYAIYSGVVNVVDQDVQLSIALVEEGTVFSVKFVVSGANGLLEGAYVDFYGRVEQTNSVGEALFANISPQGNLPFTISKEGYIDSVGVVAVTNADVEVLLTLTQDITAYNVRFKVTGVNGFIENASVDFYGRVQQTNSEGETIFENISPQENLPYTISKEGYIDSVGMVSVINADVDVSLTLRQDIVVYNVRFKVSSADGNVADAEITFENKTLLTNANGEVTFDGIVAGNNKVYLVSKVGYQSYLGDLDVVDSDVIEVVVLLPVGINDQLNELFKLYPNPSNGTFVIKMDEVNTQSIVCKIFNNTGQVVYYQGFENVNGKFEQSIEIENAKVGIYYMQLNVNNAYVFKTFIVQ